MKRIFTLLFTLFSTSAMLAQTVNLSTYVRVGRYDLPEPTRTTPPVNSLLAQEVSAVTYNWDSNTLFVVGDGGTSVVQVSKTGQLINSMTLAPGSSPQGTEFYDPEGLTYIGNGQFVMTEERDRQAVLFTYVAGGTLVRSAAKTVKLGTFVQNIGLEGLTYDPLTGGYIFVKEITPEGIFQTGIDFNAATATNGSATTENSINLFDPALANLSDFADVFALSNLPALIGQPNYGNLLVLSQEAGKIVNIDRSGNISSSLTIVSDPGNPLTVAAQQHEGLTMDRDGVLYVVSENGGGDFDHPQLWVYAPATAANLAPTAVTLTNTVTSILENTATLSPVKVADIVIADDGQGTNNISLSGADAAFFQITGSALFIKAGTVLDFETKTSYSITVNVDDASVGNTPDASTNYTLSVTDVLVETPPVATVTISEVAPWSSGNSPVAADWFEVTNNGSSALNITGWKMDDNSNVFVNSVALNGITSIAPGESVIFLETATPATTIPLFLSTWFGANPPAGLQVGSYTGAGVGLSTGGDAVNLFDAAGTLQAKVTFGASPAGPFPTFNNAAGLNNTTISQPSVVGVNGAFAAVNDAAEIGSPGTIGKLIISEVAPWSSGNSPVAADWFEITNNKAVAIDITGWKIDDNSGSPAAAIALNGITTIAPGESVIFIESATPASIVPLFQNTWFGSNPPAALKVGTYTGSGVGLGTGGDAVNVYNAAGVLQSSVLFGASSTAPFKTFDNAAGLNNTTISQLSSVGVNGAFVAKADANEIGSPGRIVNPVCTATTSTSSVSACNSYTWNGTTYNISGSYTYSTFNAAGCDSTATLNLTINTVTTGDTTVVACNSFTWNGITYTSTPLVAPVKTLTNAAGCDSLVTLHLTIKQSTSSTTNVTANNSYTFNGVTYTASGIYTATGFTNAAGCDSTATIILVINFVNTAPSVTISSPTSPATLDAGGSVTVTVTATDADGAVKKVDLYVDGAFFATDSVAPYTYSGANIPAGVYKITALATDNFGATKVSDTLVLTVINCTGSGTILAEGYTNIPGATVGSLFSSRDYPANPSISVGLTSFEYSSVGDNYGGRLRGYICPPVTGNYRFWIAADEQAYLYLSTDQNPFHIQQIAYTLAPTGFRQWAKYSSQISPLIRLEKGVRYYIETVHKESTGADHMSVSWQIPGGAFEGPIPGSRLSPWTNSAAPLAGRVTGARAFAAGIESNTLAKALQVTATPNPSTNYFTLSIKSNSSKNVNVTVLDAAGRVVETNKNAAANSTLQIGSKLIPGIYFVEVLQDNQKQRIKLVKQ